MALSCAEIIKLIKKEDFAGAFEELDSLVPEESKLEYNNLVSEFINPSDNFNKFTFAQRLIVFVNRVLKVKRTVSNPDLDFYYELCRLDFKLQTEHYKSIISYKPVAAFLLHGNTDPAGNDIKWLSNQLIYRDRKDANNPDRLDDIITIDCSLWTSVETVLQQLFDKYDVTVGNPIQLRNQLGGKLRDRLSEGHVICVMKNAESILNHDDKVAALFTDLLIFMEGHIVRNNHRNSLIFMFANNGVANFQPQNGNFFFWFDAAQSAQHAMAAVGVDGQRIIDLAPVNQLQSDDVTTWINESFQRGPDVFNKLKLLLGKESTMVGDAGVARPYEVIQNICVGLGIKPEDKWIN